MDLDAGTEEAFFSVFDADLLAGWTGLADFEAGMQKPQDNKKTGKQNRSQLRHATGEVGGKTGKVIPQWQEGRAIIWNAVLAVRWPVVN
ncbi:hypothetical protein [Rhodoferax saidenbachensis]|uniref:Uncharacterized protein n=1 Tax=Rhodoferax saidenbachensis TaxID=1484693 RepID=A0ABU1ZJS6_9BURK|nr:hypothetical protein [Rhodoferax saidenbachensis]MDR7304816.1 hypothetical protein [Rhodoferax saidenbachensis]